MSIIETYFLWFFFYSVVGWIYETILCSIVEKHFINRGFFNGPYCPIYGFGAIFNLLFLGHLDNSLLIFLAAFFLTGILEYLTSWGLEKLFHARWWDYSERKFNIHGRVYLMGGLVFALLSLLQLKYLHPLLAFFVATIIPDNVRPFVALFLFTLLLIDVVFTLTKLAELQHLLLDASLFLDHAAQSAKALYDRLSSRHQKVNSQIRRTITAFPKLKSIHHNERLKMLKELITHGKHKGEKEQ